MTRIPIKIPRNKSGLSPAVIVAFIMVIPSIQQIWSSWTESATPPKQAQYEQLSPETKQKLDEIAKENKYNTYFAEPEKMELTNEMTDRNRKTLNTSWGYILYTLGQLENRDMAPENGREDYDKLREEHLQAMRDEDWVRAKEIYNEMFDIYTEWEDYRNE